MQNHQENDDFIEDVKRLYSTDPLFSKVLTHPEKHPAFYMNDGLILSKNRGGELVLCIPKGKGPNRKSLYGIITKQAHEVIGHFGGQ